MTDETLPSDGEGNYGYDFDHGSPTSPGENDEEESGGSSADLQEQEKSRSDNDKEHFTFMDWAVHQQIYTLLAVHLHTFQPLTQAYELCWVPNWMQVAFKVVLHHKGPLLCKGVEK